jgi:hypothetical protein
VKLKIQLFAGLERDRKAISPAISTVILTGAIVVLLLVALVFANNFLEARMTENEFGAMKQFMQTVGLQVDDVAWIPGRTQTIRYASKYGQVNFVDEALIYSVYINRTGSWELLGNYTTGILLFNMPISKYSIGNNYHERIHPTSGSFLNNGTSAPASYIFVVEKLFMGDGNYIRIVVAPCIRRLDATLGGTQYFKLYLPILNSSRTHPRLSQSVTLAGQTVSVKTGSGNSLKINITFPRASEGFNSEFFNFEGSEKSLHFSSTGIVEFYTGEVAVSLGLHA